jgi:catechol 2,3-dioxygenase-like lactoylglutathione lyase family enzyme
MASLKLDHVAMPIREVAASQRFYGEVLGLPLLSVVTGDDWDGHAWLMMTFGIGDARQIALIALRGALPPAPDTLPADARHYAFAADSKRDLLAWKQRLEKKGVAFWEEDHGPQRSLYFKDPNGIVLEITAPSSGAISGPPPTRMAEAIAAWLKQSE